MLHKYQLLGFTVSDLHIPSFFGFFVASHSQIRKNTMLLLEIVACSASRSNPNGGGLFSAKRGAKHQPKT